MTLAPVSDVDSANHRRAAMDIDVRAHPPQLGHVHVAVLEDGLLEEAVPFAQG